MWGGGFTPIPPPPPYSNSFLFNKYDLPLLVYECILYQLCSTSSQPTVQYLSYPLFNRNHIIREMKYYTQYTSTQQQPVFLLQRSHTSVRRKRDIKHYKEGPKNKRIWNCSVETVWVGGCKIMASVTNPPQYKTCFVWKPKEDIIVCG